MVPAIMIVLPLLQPRVRHEQRHGAAAPGLAQVAGLDQEAHRLGGDEPVVAQLRQRAARVGDEAHEAEEEELVARDRRVRQPELEHPWRRAGRRRCC